MANSEHDEQAAFFEWCEAYKTQYPVLGRFFAVPNGGHRKKAVAGKLKAEGVKRGVPDVFNLTSNTSAGIAAWMHYIGLILEFKVGKNALTPEQRDWKLYFEDQGYRVEVPRSWNEAVIITIDYFGLPQRLKNHL